MKNKVFDLHTRQRGFTLVEVLIALAISGLLLTAVYSAFLSQQRSYLAQDQVAEVQQNIRAGIDKMVQELRMAGFDPYRSGTAGFTQASATSVGFTLVADDDGIDNNNDGTIDENGELTILSFDLFDAYGDGDTDIGRQAGSSAATKRAIAENIDQLEFLYFDQDGGILDTSITANLRRIHSVQISLLARADRPDTQFTNTETYTTASGAVWGPYNDNFRRRF
ncbi:MAG: prepilin-type N-terminal cleavage/methylation domain-containing protein, partial [Desulfuromonas sp.]